MKMTDLAENLLVKLQYDIMEICLHPLYVFGLKFLHPFSERERER